MALLTYEQIRQRKKSPLKIDILERLQQGPCGRRTLQECLNAKHPEHSDYWGIEEIGTVLYQLCRDYQVSRKGRGDKALYTILNAGEVYLREADAQERG